MAVTDFEVFFREQYPRLVALGTSMCGDREVARELAQETMARAHAHWADVAEYEAPGGWVHRVMTNLLIDHHRSRRAERVAVARLAARAERATPGEHGSGWGELVGLLATRQRMVVTLFYGADQSIEQIAAALGLRVGSVKSALGKARQRLAETLETSNAEDSEGGER